MPRPLTLRKPHKYGAVATVVDGIRFPSKREANRWTELRLLELAGEIHSLERQPRLSLDVNGTQIGQYVADFKYRDSATARWVYEDAKGVLTRDCKWKLKHVRAQYGIEVVLV
jgi:hypothetical protein